MFTPPPSPILRNSIWQGKVLSIDILNNLTLDLLLIFIHSDCLSVLVFNKLDTLCTYGYIALFAPLKTMTINHSIETGVI